MPDEYGAVLDVTTMNQGATLTVAVSIGATTLTVDDVSVFEEAAGQIWIEGAIYDYTAIDYDLNTITLLSGTTDSYGADETRVESYPFAPLRTALVSFAVEEGEAVRVTIPHYFSGMPDGVRPPGSEEVALIEERAPGELYLKDVMAKGTILLAGAEDLDNYVAQATFIQTQDSQAASGFNYPVPYAGVLEVLSTNPNDLVLQRYTAYQTVTDLHYPSAWTRMFGGGDWSPWKPLNIDNPVEADLSANNNATITTTATTIPALTVDITPRSASTTYLVMGVFDCTGTAGATNTPVAELFIDSTAEADQAIGTGPSDRNTIAQNWIISGLSPTTHTFALKARGSTGISGYTVGVHSTMKIIRLTD